MWPQRLGRKEVGQAIGRLGQAGATVEILFQVDHSPPHLG